MSAIFDRKGTAEPVRRPAAIPAGWRWVAASDMGPEELALAQGGDSRAWPVGLFTPPEEAR